MPGMFESVIRAEDLLYCQFEFVNLALGTSASGAPQLTRAAAGPAFLVVRLPPQNIAEQAVPDGTSSTLPYPGGLAGPSRLTFRVPDAAPPIDFNLEALLAFVGNADLFVDGLLADQTTAIECPDRLLLVPQPLSRLIHRSHPVTSQTTGVTELWHTTLHDPATGVSGRLRAIANPSDHSDRPFATGLKKTQRDAIVALSGQSANIAASVLRLTALGATARLKSDWPPVPPNSTIGLTEWEHQTEAGRDLYVRTVDQGYLFPFGHRAAITTVTQRGLVSRFPGQTAELVQKSFLAILEPERSYEGLGAYPGIGREMPFVLARIASAPQELTPGAPIQISLLLTDRAGSHLDCEAFVFFVNAGDAANDASLAPLRDRYQTMSVVTLGAQRVAMADYKGGVYDTSLNVVSMNFGVKLQSELAALAVPGFLPFMATAEARIPALEQMVGTCANATPATQRRAASVQFHDSYIQDGFKDHDSKQVYAKFASLADGLAIPAERAGGLAAPRFRGIDGLSRLTGPVAGVEQFVNSNSHAINPNDLVGEAKLLGVIPLNMVIAAVTDAAADAFPVDRVGDLFDQVENLGPTFFVSRPVMTTVTGASGVETRFVWKPRLADSLPAPLMKTSDQMELILKGRIMADARSPSSPPAFAVEGKLRNFALSLLGLVTVRFDSVEFKSQSGSKVDVKPHVAGIDFLGSLAFVEKLQELLPTKSLADVPQVETLPDGVTVRHAIAIPSVSLGVMTIENLALSSSFSLPFVEGKPAAVGFALSRRDNPFQISVSIFGGTGFFSLQALTADKGLIVEAALEFGAVAELDLVVIKGGVHVFVGIYLSMGPDDLVIEGHLRFGGYIDVLGLISLSIEFYLALTYIGSRNVLSGTGRLTVGVKLLFYSESFSFEIHREIAGFGAAPSGSPLPPAHQTAVASHLVLAEAAAAAPLQPAIRAPAMSADQWERYCRAFA
jgi:hypothetical protein